MKKHGLVFYTVFYKPAADQFCGRLMRSEIPEGEKVMI